jgi:hypothetical protein
MSVSRCCGLLSLQTLQKSAQMKQMYAYCDTWCQDFVVRCISVMLLIIVLHLVKLHWCYGTTCSSQHLGVRSMACTNGVWVNVYWKVEVSEGQSCTEMSVQQSVDCRTCYWGWGGGEWQGNPLYYRGMVHILWCSCLLSPNSWREVPVIHSQSFDTLCSCKGVIPIQSPLPINHSISSHCNPEIQFSFIILLT